MGNSRHPRQTRHRRPSVPGVYRRSKLDKHSGEKKTHGKWLPRMKPPREQLSSGGKFIYDHLPLGGYDTPQDAKIVRDIAAFYYGKAEVELTLANGQAFSIPSMSEQEKQILQGIEKRQWVCRKAKEVFEDFKSEALKDATSMRNGALVSSEAATMTVVASSPEITGSQQLASPSPEDSALNQFLEDLQFDNFDIRNGFFPASDSPSLPILLWDEGDALGSTSEEMTSMEVDRLQQQPWESQRLELQRQLGEAQNLQVLELQWQLGEAPMQILELQREMELLRSELRQRSFCLHKPYNWIS